MKREVRLHTLGFTLIELLCVITIIALLAGLLLPVTGTMLNRANNLKCLNNLRQIVIAANAAANDNNNQYPIIEIDPTGNTQIPSPDGTTYQTLDVALKPYGVTAALLQCPADIKGQNYYSKYNSSYMWAPYSEGENNVQITKYTRRGQHTVPLSRVILVSDWGAPHFNSLGAGMDCYAGFADGHSASTNRSGK